MTKEEKAMKLHAKQRGKYNSRAFGPKMAAKLNEIALMFFEGNYKFKPGRSSLLKFARTKPNEKRIKEYLGSRVWQEKYSEYY